MAEQFENNRQYEETILPIRRQPLEAPAAGASGAQKPLGRSWFVSRGVVTGILVILLMAVFFVLPRVTERPEPQRAAVETAPEVIAPPSTLSPEQRAEFDRQAQRDLAALLTQQNRLESRLVDQWGGQGWLDYQALSRSGDDAYLVQDVEAAVHAYADALALGDELLARSNSIVAEAMASGTAALEAGNAEAALTEFELVSGIFPGHAGARDGKARALRLPDVLALMREGHAVESTGELPAAIDLYKQALAIDPAWTPAREALAAANGRLAQYSFDRALSDGFAALGESRFADAVDAFNAALAMRPDSSAAADGLFQAEEGARLGQISLARVRALAFERRELWSEAIAIYESALAIDPTLDFALEGVARAQARHDLDLKLENLVNNPRLLFDDKILADAGRLLEEARAVEPQGARIEDQRGRLDRLITLASTPLTVELRSDALTEVTVFRVGTIGTFTSTQIDLRPGDYTVIGSRNGYRDVRHSFTVVPGQVPGPIEVVCVEPI